MVTDKHIYHLSRRRAANQHATYGNALKAECGVDWHFGDAELCHAVTPTDRGVSGVHDGTTTRLPHARRLLEVHALDGL